MKPLRREPILFAVTLVGLLLTYHWIFAPFFPAANGGIGHDYAYFMPHLLDGYFWYLNNGVFSPPWFTAAFCGGVPAFANPQNLYYSLPQWLSFARDPLEAVYLTLLLFAAIGFAGFYLLLRRGFNTSAAMALLGASLFLFNGFFAHRLLIGHLSFHSFMLLPLIAYLLLPLGSGSRPGIWARVALAALLFAYIIYAGGAQIILPVIIAVMIVGLVHGLCYGNQARFWLRLTTAGLLSIGLALAKLLPALAYLGNFQRSDYQLPGADSLWGLLTLAFETLFLQPSGETVQAVITNTQWTLSRHEFEYGITLVPVIMLLLAALFWLRQRPKPQMPDASRWLQLGALVLLLLLPLVLNLYTPGWHAVLKEIPVLRNSSILIRWFCIYIPVIILFASLALDRRDALRRFQPYLAGAGILAVVLINVYGERGYYANQTYNPTPIVEAHEQAAASGEPVVIDEIFAFRDPQGRIALPIFRNNTLVLGASQLFCYEPLFGYRLEMFPFEPMRPGPVDKVIDGRLNLKDPSCYLFGPSNQCRPGDHFSADRAEAARALTHYRPFDFQRPWWQHSAELISLVTLAAIMLFLLGYATMALRQARRRQRTPDPKP